MSDVKKYAYDVEIDSCTHTTREGRADDVWDRGDSATTHRFIGIKPTQEPHYGDVVSTLDIAGKECWVVWAVYSTGDSFGHDEDAGTEILGVFEDARSAAELKHAAENNSDAYSFSITTSDGQVFDELHAPWVGYFESLSYVEISHAVCSLR